MDAKCGNYKGSRVARAGGPNSCNGNNSSRTAERHNQGPSSYTPAVQSDSKDVGHPTVPSTDSGEFNVIHAILESRSNPRLDSVQRLLKNVVAGAATVVRGTDSQRRFTSTYTEFCLSALRCMADLEDAVFEHSHPGRRATDAADDEIDGIAEDFFLKQVAAYVSTHTKSLGLAYLEHVALGALEKQRQQRKRERSSGGSLGANARAVKVGRTGSGGLSSAGGRSANSATASSGFGALNHHDSNGSGPIAGSVSGGYAFDSQGLIDAPDTVREALQIIEPEKNTGSADCSRGGGGTNNDRRRGPQVVTAALGKDYTGNCATGLFVSKTTAAGATAGAAGGEHVVYDLRNPQLRLSSIPELSALLQPWTMPLPTSGVFIERVAMERERKGAGCSANVAGSGNMSTSTPTGSGGGNNSSGSYPALHMESARAILEVCLAPTPMELLRRYEAHELVLTAEPQLWRLSSPSLSAGPYSVVPYAGKHGGGIVSGGSPCPITTALLPIPPPPLNTSHSNDAGNSLQDGESLANALTEGDADALASSAFFPAVRETKTLTCLPQFVISNLSHIGVSRMEFVYNMALAPKQL